MLPDEDWDGPEQGLFVCLPAEELTLEGFTEDGRADTMAPGPLLAAVVGAVTGDDARGLKGTSDDQLAGIISASLRLESRAAWTRLAALAAGRIHPVHLQIIEDETRFLKPEDAARADEILCQQAPSLTFGKLRSAAHRLALELDPEAAQRRKEAARRETHVRAFREASGNAGLIARELPS